MLSDEMGESLPPEDERARLVCEKIAIGANVRIFALNISNVCAPAPQERNLRAYGNATGRKRQLHASP